LSMVKDYGFRIDGRTGEGYLPRKQEANKFSLPKCFTNGWADSELKSRYGTKADKLEAGIYKKIRKYLYELENNICFDHLSISIGPELNSVECQGWGFSQLIKKHGRHPIKGQLTIKYVEPELWEISGSGDLEHVKIIYGTVADKLEQKFYEEIVKSLAKSNIRFDRIVIKIEPDLKWADCWIDGLTQCKKIEGTEVWERIKGHLGVENIDRLNWKISGSRDIGHIKIDINVEPLLSSLQGSILQFRLVADMTPEQVKEVSWPNSDLDGYIWLPLASYVEDTRHVKLSRRRIDDMVYMLVSNKPNQTMLADGSWLLKDTSTTTDMPGNPAVRLRFNKEGLRKMNKLQERRNRGRQLAACIDGEINSVSRIGGHKGYQVLITADFTKEQAKSLAKSLLNGTHLKSEEAKAANTFP